MRRVILLSVCGVLLSGQVSDAQFVAAVHDAPAAAQRGVLWGQEALQWAQALNNQVLAYKRQYDELVNGYNIIRMQISQYETMVKNLQRLPENLNVFSTVTAYGNTLTGLLSQANTLGYGLDNATRQFADLYGEGAQLAQGDLTAVRQKFLAARLQSSQLAVQVQSIQTQSASIFQRLCDLLNGVSQAQGNLDLHQLAAQQQALQLTTLQHIQALQATAARLQAQREAEDVALQRLKQRVQQEFLRPLPEYTVEQGALPTWGWVTTTD